MGKYKVRFVPGNGAESFEQKCTMENGYRLEKPESPTMKGDKFVAWCTRDGKEFDFDQLVTESITLYAKWEKGGIIDYEQVTGDVKGVDFIPYLAVGLSAVITVGIITSCVLILKRRKPNASSKKEKTN